jgi:hypothetical protein
VDGVGEYLSNQRLQPLHVFANTPITSRVKPNAPYIGWSEREVLNFASRSSDLGFDVTDVRNAVSRQHRTGAEAALG